jgi:hypothetical protein
MDATVDRMINLLLVETATVLYNQISGYSYSAIKILALNPLPSAGSRTLSRVIVVRCAAVLCLADLPAPSQLLAPSTKTRFPLPPGNLTFTPSQAAKVDLAT